MSGTHVQLYLQGAVHILFPERVDVSLMTEITVCYHSSPVNPTFFNKLRRLLRDMVQTDLHAAGSLPQRLSYNEGSRRHSLATVAPALLSLTQNSKHLLCLQQASSSGMCCSLAYMRAGALQPKR